MKTANVRTSPVVQWLGLCDSTAEGPGSIPDWELRSHKLCREAEKTNKPTNNNSAGTDRRENKDAGRKFSEDVPSSPGVPGDKQGNINIQRKNGKGAKMRVLVLSFDVQHWMVWKPIYMEMTDWVTWAPWGWWTLTGWDTAIRSLGSSCIYTLRYLNISVEKEMATHSSILAWRISGTEEPGGLLSTGSHRVGHVWSDLAAAAM